MKKLDMREVWNDSVGVVLCLAGLIGVGFKVEYAGWLIFFGVLFFFNSPDKKGSPE